MALPLCSNEPLSQKPSPIHSMGAQFPLQSSISPSGHVPAGKPKHVQFGLTTSPIVFGSPSSQAAPIVVRLASASLQSPFACTVPGRGVQLNCAEMVVPKPSPSPSMYQMKSSSTEPSQSLSNPSHVSGRGVPALP